MEVLYVIAALAGLGCIVAGLAISKQIAASLKRVAVGVALIVGAAVCTEDACRFKHRGACEIIKEMTPSSLTLEVAAGVFIGGLGLGIACFMFAQWNRRG